MSMSSLELLNQPNILLAVAGATDDPDKFGHAVYRDLKHKHYRVFPVNPWRETVDGDCAYPNIQMLPEVPDLVVLVVPPDSSLAVAQDCMRAGISHLWLQPGAESPAVLDYLRENGFNYVAGACIMVKTRRAKQTIKL